MLVTMLYYADDIMGLPSSSGVTSDKWDEKLGRHYTLVFHAFVLM